MTKVSEKKKFINYLMFALGRAAQGILCDFVLAFDCDMGILS